jgi:hypothetical protein
MSRLQRTRVGLVAPDWGRSSATQGALRVILSFFMITHDSNCRGYLSPATTDTPNNA